MFRQLLPNKNKINTELHSVYCADFGYWFWYLNQAKKNLRYTRQTGSGSGRPTACTCCSHMPLAGPTCHLPHRRFLQDTTITMHASRGLASGSGRRSTGRTAIALYDVPCLTNGQWPLTSMRALPAGRYSSRHNTTKRPRTYGIGLEWDRIDGERTFCWRISTCCCCYMCTVLY
jgi:hypothetical protein